MRMGMRRYARLANGFSKKVENHAYRASLHFMHYNFGRNHQSLRIKRDNGTYAQHTPAMGAGFAEYQWSLSQLVGFLD